MDDMYKVYRCVEGVKDFTVGSFTAFAEAYTCAQRSAARQGSRYIHFRIYGPLPEYMRTGRNEATHRVWFVLDDSPRPHGAFRASEVMAKLGDTPETRAQPARTFASVSPEAWEYTPHEIVYYRVDLVEHGVHHTIRNGFPTEHEAQDFVRRWKRKRGNRGATLVIVAGVTSSRSGRRRHDWEIEDRKTDASLVERSEEELGLGIPAQWGKGRRSRKGDYIP